MDVSAATMTIPFGQAQDAYRTYQQAVRTKTATREDLMLYRGLRALVRGRKVIDINAAIGNAGRDAHGRPRFAIARADWTSVICDGTGAGFRFTSSVFGRRPKGTLDIPLRCFGRAPAPVPDSHTIRCTAQVPLIPPQYRPPSAPAGYHLLFEAVWQRQPPVDPMSLQRIDGPFYVVLAVWDLTPLEQSVLRART